MRWTKPHLLIVDDTSIRDSRASFLSHAGWIELYIPHQGQVYLVSRDYPNQMEYLQAEGSFRFIN